MFFILVEPNYSESDNVRLTVASVTSSSVELQWGQQQDLPQGIPDLGMYYGYSLSFRPNHTGTYTEYATYNHNTQSSDLTAVVNVLEYNQPYIFKVQPYKQWDSLIDYGWEYPLVTATTRCIGK